MSQGVDFIEKLLARGGLYDKEVKMVSDIWLNHFFFERGAKLIYLMPENLVNSYLPLEITPKPDEIKRVILVCINWSMMQEITAILKDLKSIDHTVRSAAIQRAIQQGLAIKPYFEGLLNQAENKDEQSVYKYIILAIEKLTQKK